MRRTPRSTRVAALAALAAVVATTAAVGVVSPGCRSATQVTVEIRTTGSLTCAELKGVAIVVARTPTAAEEKLELASLSAEIARGECGSDPRLLGTLVVTPGESTGAIVVRARVSDSPESTCKSPDYKGCIVSRRAFSFIDHASVTLPITLELSCADVPCDVMTSCRTGKCVSSTAECSAETERCDSPAEPAVTADGSAPVPDDSALPDGALPDGALPDGALPDGALADASADADAAVNSGEDCPTGAVGGEDCFFANAGTTPVCCAEVPDARFRCTDEPGCPGLYPHYYCTNTEHCMGGALCCAGMGDAGGLVAQCTPDPVAACAGGYQALCKTSADCPVGAKSCTKAFATLGGKTIFGCE